MSATIKLRRAPPGVNVPRKKAAKRSRAKRSVQKHPDRANQFAIILAVMGGGEIPRPELEFKFHAVRKWRFDFAWPDHKLAVEIEGGMFQGSNTGHRSITGMMRDIEKYNAAQLDGWCVLRFHAKDLDERPGSVVAWVKLGLGLKVKKRGRS